MKTDSLIQWFVCHFTHFPEYAEVLCFFSAGYFASCFKNGKCKICLLHPNIFQENFEHNKLVILNSESFLQLFVTQPLHMLSLIRYKERQYSYSPKRWTPCQVAFFVHYLPLEYTFQIWQPYTLSIILCKKYVDNFCVVFFPLRYQTVAR